MQKTREKYADPQPTFIALYLAKTRPRRKINRVTKLYKKKKKLGVQAKTGNCTEKNSLSQSRLFITTAIYLKNAAKFLKEKALQPPYIKAVLLLSDYQITQKFKNPDPN